MSKIVIVTGATSGIGKASALLFAKNNYKVIITGRRSERLDELKAAIEQFNVKCYTLNFDVRDKDSVVKNITTLPNEWKNINVLVNNAGLGLGKEPLQEGNSADWDVMIDTNVKGLLYITEAVLPLMPTNGTSHIVNISSISGLQAYPGGNVYCASKHAVEGLTNGMRIDLLDKSIKVTSIAPGLVETEFSMVRFKGDKEKAAAAYKGIAPLTGEDIAECVFWAVDRPANVSINQITVMAGGQADAVFIKRDND